MNTQNLKDSADRAGRELRGELDGLSDQVERLAGEISRLGKSGARSARSSASRGLGVLSRTGADLTDGLGREIAHVEDRAAGAVRERPLQSLGIAVVIGFLLALIWRR